MFQRIFRRNLLVCIARLLERNWHGWRARVKARRVLWTPWLHLHGSLVAKPFLSRGKYTSKQVLSPANQDPTPRCVSNFRIWSHPMDSYCECFLCPGNVTLAWCFTVAKVNGPAPDPCWINLSWGLQQRNNNTAQSQDACVPTSSRHLHTHHQYLHPRHQ